MKGYETKIFVFIASIIVGILIVMNISFGPAKQTKFLTAEEYMDAINERSKLTNDISLLRHQYAANHSKYQRYVKNSFNPSDSLKIIESMKEELARNEALIGLEAVEGQGVSITIDDSSEIDLNNQLSDYESNNKIVHNTDIIELIYELNLAGAEAISVNGMRIMSNSEVACAGPFILINDVKLTAPFYIDVIGNGQSIKEYLYAQDTHVGILTILTSPFRNIKVDFSIKENVKIPAYIGNYEFKYAKEVKNN
ncbi:MAG: DUF881 domain-containing protein [Clostridiales bacterium]|uniref:DUF881 domain-containing protein n=1 Tax=Clostridium sp. N3C TaxID=1776758 RepID=UPI00092E0E86|nr:DUF881 domain-containing protein [Clostridium sp. N3C]NLZ47334.1 DUF881 domain-containing protein [Clostridiales bacterium]SCN21349.1 hypothetical protein N3C_0125 [Clostridium sp. N3C]